MIVGPVVPAGAGTVLLAVVVSCFGVRWGVPTLLRLLAKSVRTVVALCAAAMIWPEYRISSARRRENKDPSQLAYDYSAVVGWIAMVADRLFGFVLNGLADSVRSIPMRLVALVATVVTVVWLLL